MMKRIAIHWSQAYPISKYENAQEITQKGIYQIFKRFRNKEILYYIGIVKGQNRNFKQRIKEHIVTKDFLKENQIFIRFGLVKSKIDDEELEEIEGALIFDTQPMMNKSKISTYSKNNDYLIHNEGEKGVLNELIDTSKHYTITLTNTNAPKKDFDYKKRIERFRQCLMKGIQIQFATVVQDQPFVCFMIPNRKTLHFITSGGGHRYTSFENLYRYFENKQIKDEPNYVKAIGLFLEHAWGDFEKKCL